jgi:uncharacterized protein YjiS (DUF1127 family)
MPPQPTDLRSGTKRDAARLRLVVASVENATGGALAAARPDASTAALTDACPEQETGSKAPSTRNVLSLLQRCWRAFQEWRQRERSRTSLHELSARELEDIGLTPGNIDYIVARRAMDRLRDGTTQLWQSRGVM